MYQHLLCPCPSSIRREITRVQGMTVHWVCVPREAVRVFLLLLCGP